MNRPWTRRDFGRLWLAASASTLASRKTLGAAAAKVVVIGGGAGGATAARYLAAAGDGIEVTLVNETPVYTTCIFSNLFLGGFRSFESISHGYDALRAHDRLELVFDRAIDVDPDARIVALRGGGRLAYDRLVVAPGIDFKYDAIEGYTSETARVMPHAWRAGEQTLVLQRQMAGMEDGGTFVICPPPHPYRCPPAPYERASLVAHYLKTHKPRSKVLIVDAKSSFPKQALFEEGWQRFYPDMIEWLPADMTGGGVKAVDPKAGTVIVEDETFEASVANVIPPQTAGRIARDSGLADESGWCPVAPATLASKLLPNVHVVGDAIIPGDMPKSGFAANSQAKLCAGAILTDLLGAESLEARLGNACWSFIAIDHAVKLAGDYLATDENFVKTGLTLSALDESDEVRARTARDAMSWYEGFTRDLFG